VLGGEAGEKGASFQIFRDLVTKAWCVLRKSSYLFFALIDIQHQFGLLGESREHGSYLNEVFQFGKSDEEFAVYAQNLLVSSIERAMI